MMPDEMRLEMEDDKLRRPDLYRHKWLGEPLALAESRIYKGWNIIKEIPHEARLVRRGLDFGYSNDEAAIIAVYKYNGGLILDEELYLKKQSNGNLADTIVNQTEQCLVVADSSEPKSIAEIKSQGVNIVGAIKKGDKTGPYKTYNRWAISKVQDEKISVTERSINLIAEYRKYMWMEDKDGNILSEPEGGFDQYVCSALDSISAVRSVRGTGNGRISNGWRLLC
jgi:phage terminase large subunit